MATITTAAGVARKPTYSSLFGQVLAALLLGIVLGMAIPDFAIGLKIFSDAFLKLSRRSCSASSCTELPAPAI